MPSDVVVGVADCRVSNDPGHVLVTYALGSCIAVAIHDPTVGVGGLLHFMLPDSALDRVKAAKNPFLFADTGIPLLFRTAYEKGASKHRLRVQVAGGAQVLDASGTFNIGERNYLALRKILWKAGVRIHNEAVGGAASRTVRLEVLSGKFWLRTPGMADQEIPRALPFGRG